MGSDWGEFWRRILRFSCFGHQSLFERIPRLVVPCMTGHLPTLLSPVFASMGGTPSWSIGITLIYAPCAGRSIVKNDSEGENARGSESLGLALHQLVHGFGHQPVSHLDRVQVPEIVDQISPGIVQPIHRGEEGHHAPDIELI